MMAEGSIGIDGYARCPIISFDVWGASPPRSSCDPAIGSGRYKQYEFVTVAQLATARCQQRG